MCSYIYNMCFKRDKSVDVNNNIEVKPQVQNIKIEQQFKRNETSSSNYNLYIIQKNIQQLVDLQKLQMEYIKEIERLHNNKYD